VILPLTDQTSCPAVSWPYPPHGPDFLCYCPQALEINIEILHGRKLYACKVKHVIIEVFLSDTCYHWGIFVWYTFYIRKHVHVHRHFPVVSLRFNDWTRDFHRSEAFFADITQKHIRPLHLNFSLCMSITVFENIFTRKITARYFFSQEHRLPNQYYNLRYLQCISPYDQYLVEMHAVFTYRTCSHVIYVMVLCTTCVFIFYPFLLNAFKCDNVWFAFKMTFE
jgi:hypothetical protein